MESFREKSGKSQGILKWKMSGNTTLEVYVVHLNAYVPEMKIVELTNSTESDMVLISHLFRIYSFCLLVLKFSK